MSRLLLLGATGHTGGHVLDAALENGHEVTALVRDASRLPARSGLTVVQGQVSRAEDVRRALEGCCSVISTLGPRDRHSAICAQGSVNVIAALAGSEASRYVVLGGSGTPLPEDRRGPGGQLMVLAMRLALPGIVADKKLEAAALRASSGVDWTLVRAPIIRPARAGARSVRVRTGRPAGWRVDVAQLAAFLAQLALNRDYIGQAPFVAS